MDKDKGLIALGIGASLVAAFCTYKITKGGKRSKRKVRRLFKTKDVDGWSESGLTDVELTILNGEDGTDRSYTENEYSEQSVPLNKVSFDRIKMVTKYS